MNSWQWDVSASEYSDDASVDQPGSLPEIFPDEQADNVRIAIKERLKPKSIRLMPFKESKSGAKGA